MLPDKNFEKMDINKHAVIYPCMKFQSFFCRTSDYVTKLCPKRYKWQKYSKINIKIVIKQ